MNDSRSKQLWTYRFNGIEIIEVQDVGPNDEPEARRQAFAKISKRHPGRSEFELTEWSFHEEHYGPVIVKRDEKKT